MSFGNSAGVYERIIDRSFAVSGSGLLVGAVVVTADRGPLEPNYVTSAQEFIETYGTPSSDNPSLFSALRFLNRAPALTVIRVINDATVASGALQDSAGTGVVMDFEAANPGAWGNNISIEFADPVGTRQSDNIFVVIVKDGGNVVEQFEVSRDPSEKNGYGNSLYVEDVINSQSNYIRVEDDPTVEIGGVWDRTSVIELASGADDTSVASTADIVSAFNLMKNTEEVEAQILINAGWTDVAVQQAMDAVAQARGDAVAILDVPQNTNKDVQAMVEFLDTELMLNSNLSGLYGGWIRIYDQYNDREVEIPPSGDVAGVFVHTVNVAERWSAPAGLRRGIIPNTLGVSDILDEGERDLLYTNRINPVTSYGGAAAVIWGQRNTQVATSALDRFNVVNSIIWMKNRMRDALQPFVFENNTKMTRDQISYLLSSFLENIRTRGGLYDFHVDMTANTPEVIDRNELIVNVHVQPVRTAEFIRLNIIVDRTGITYG